MIDSMKRILIWTEAEVRGLAKACGLSCILTEVDARGAVTRELGLDVGGNVVHRHPGKPTRAPHGLFDLTNIAPSDETEIELAEFNRLWAN